MKFIVITLFAFSVLVTSEIFADGFRLTLIYSTGEKSKHNHSETYKIEISGLEVNYSEDFTGHNAKKSCRKNCLMTGSQQEQIIQVLKEKKLTVNDSLFEETSKYKASETFVNITFDLVLEEIPYSIRVNGDKEVIEGTPLYKNLIFLLEQIKGFIEEC